MVLAHSLRDSGTRKQLVILVTLDSVAGSTVEELKARVKQVKNRVHILTDANRQCMII